jgi:hypothetical protein
MSASRYWWNAAENFTVSGSETTQGSPADADGRNILVIEVIEEFGAGRPRMCLSVADYVTSPASVFA